MYTHCTVQKPTSKPSQLASISKNAKKCANYNHYHYFLLLLTS